MALRLGFAWRLRSTSSFASQLSFPAATSAAAAAAKPAPIPSDTLFVSGEMALRLGLARRLLSTSSFASQLSFPAATAAAAKPAPIPSDALFVSGETALRLGFARRLLSTSSFASQLSAPAATAAAAGDKPAPIPSDTLFVSGLNKRTTTEKLHEAFSQFGQVVHAKIVTDRNSGYSKGFGFVKYASIEDAAKGIEGMDAKFLDGWVIFAEYARPRPPPGQETSQDTYTPRSRY